MSTEWHHWEQVTEYVKTGHKLYRSSAPNYAGSDSTQKLTSTAVQYLTSQGIDSIISFNVYSYTDSEKALLIPAKITYLHLAVVDYTAPTLTQLETAITFFDAHKSTLFHCGYGHGRTGTGVTALQLAATKGQNPVESLWKSENYVEKSVQLAVLKKLRDKLKQQ